MFKTRKIECFSPTHLESSVHISDKEGESAVTVVAVVIPIVIIVGAVVIFIMLHRRYYFSFYTRITSQKSRF